MDDLRYFARVICNAGYIHMPILAPTKDMLSNYRIDKAWETYEVLFMNLLKERMVETIDPEIFPNACLLCSESNPDKCHRRLVTEYLAAHSSRKPLSFFKMCRFRSNRL